MSKLKKISEYNNVGTIKELIILITLVVGSIISIYQLGPMLSNLWFLLLFIVYYNSKNEAFWLAFFIIVSDGFLGFLGKYGALIEITPAYAGNRIPGIEVAQVYIFLTLIKVLRNKKKTKVILGGILRICLLYIIILIILGQFFGVQNLNAQLRILKLVLPLLLFYSLPRLIVDEHQLRKLFYLLFPFTFGILFAQIFNLIIGTSPAAYLGFTETNAFGKGETYTTLSNRIYRGFYNPNLILINYLGALYFLSSRKKLFNINYLYVITVSIFLAVILSATRGYILGISIIFLLFTLVVQKLKIYKIAILSIFTVVIILVINFSPAVEYQFNKSLERFQTLELILQGDTELGGTLGRISNRSPRVMNKWEEQPYFGWGFSDTYFEYEDGHVGNQNILLHSGVFGLALIMVLLIAFNSIFIQKSVSLNYSNIFKYKLMLFPIFLLGYFIIHSTSGQQISFYNTPDKILLQVLLFTIAIIAYRSATQSELIKSLGKK